MRLIALLILFVQGIPALRVEGGTVTGMLKTSSGLPAVGVRVAAAAKADPADLSGVDKLASLAETDANGRYLLENIPPGRYYITAGRLDLPTYYPGTLDVSAGTVVEIVQGARLSGLDFALREESAGRSLTSMVGRPMFDLPLQVNVEGGGKVPIVVGESYPVLRLTLGGLVAQEFQLNTPYVTLPIPSAASPGGDYLVEVADIPGYEVKSLVSGTGQNAVDLTKNPLRVRAQGFPSLAPTVFRSSPIPGGTLTTHTTLLARSDMDLFVVLTRKARESPRPEGVRVIGSGLPTAVPIYLSGIPGTVYADGSFEFEGVLPGRHTLVRLPAQGISVVVGDRDVEGVKLQSTNLLPLDIETDAPRPAGNHPAGMTLPLASIRGRVVDDVTGQPLIDGGAVTIRGYRGTGRAYLLDQEGRFVIPDLLPGSYRLDLSVTGYEGAVQTVVVDDGDFEVTFRGQREP